MFGIPNCSLSQLLLISKYTVVENAYGIFPSAPCVTVAPFDEGALTEESGLMLEANYVHGFGNG